MAERLAPADNGRTIDGKRFENKSQLLSEREKKEKEARDKAARARRAAADGDGAEDEQSKEARAAKVRPPDCASLLHRSGTLGFHMCW